MIATFVAGALIAGGPPLAASVFDATNADKVDGRDAVGAGASPAARAGKLVATNAAGRLPNNIIATAPNSARLGGRATSGYQRRVTGTCPSDTYITAFGAAGGVTCTTDGSDGGDAQTLDGRDAADFAAADKHVIFVPRDGTPTQNGAALRSAMAAAGGGSPPNATNPWLVQLEPGNYDLGTGSVQIPDFVHLQGAGNGSVIQTANGASAAVAQRSVLILGDDTSVRSLRVVHDTQGNGFSGAIYVEGDRVLIADVDVEVTAGSGPSATGIHAVPDASPLDVRNVDVSVTGSAIIAAGISLSSSVTATVTDSTVSAASTAGAGGVAGLILSGLSLTIVRTDVTASGAGVFARAVSHSGGTTVVDASSLRATGSTAPRSIFVQGGTMRVSNSLIQGTRESSGDLVCVGTYSPGFTALGATCV